MIVIVKRSKVLAIFQQVEIWNRDISGPIT